ncbi:hypothetical protein [Desulfomicrobium baculatum]|uniref:Uncharacterized protein n=1 Tax=Desulfomicrobium baculatum (strain DSM 4028 / VKM B-1378 / X) TaxID=525897 RepID=C7LRW5_DESBD|nr:hypothetical protein [Desulfomicrobium baculatum]ACU89348.1 hypothetical protein Dbac_1245 [Desulfomicrobium baculatum DSM 4028]
MSIFRGLRNLLMTALVPVLLLTAGSVEKARAETGFMLPDHGSAAEAAVAIHRELYELERFEIMGRRNVETLAEMVRITPEGLERQFAKAEYLGARVEHVRAFSGRVIRLLNFQVALIRQKELDRKMWEERCSSPQYQGLQRLLKMVLWLEAGAPTPNSKSVGAEVLVVQQVSADTHALIMSALFYPATQSAQDLETLRMTKRNLVDGLKSLRKELVYLSARLDAVEAQGGEK